jgi:hypothetical protein
MSDSGRPKRPPAPRVSDALASFTSSEEEAVAYEVALEHINEVVGACSARIARERARPDPDRDAIAAWLAEQGRCAEVRRGLDPSDHAAVARVRKEYAVLARLLRDS